MRFPLILLLTPLLLLAQQALAKVVEEWYYLPYALDVIYYDNHTISALDFVDGTMKYHVHKIINQSTAVASAYHTHFYLDAKQHEQYLRKARTDLRFLEHWPAVSEALVEIAASAYDLSQLRNYDRFDRADCHLSADNLVELNVTLPKLGLSKYHPIARNAAVRTILSIERAQLKECAYLAQEIPEFYADHIDALYPLIEALRSLMYGIGAEDAAMDQQWQEKLEQVPWWKASSSSHIRETRLDFQSEHSARISALVYLKGLIRHFETALNTVVPATAASEEDLEDVSKWSVWTKLHAVSLHLAAHELRTRARRSVDFEMRHGLGMIDLQKLAPHVQAMLEREQRQLNGCAEDDAEEVMESYLQTAAMFLNRPKVERSDTDEKMIIMVGAPAEGTWVVD